MITPRRVLALSAAFVACSQAMAASYYVASDGDDSGPGTSPERPWQTVARVSSARFEAGDNVRFKGGQTFSGSLRLTREDSGAASKPLTISSYGEGRATIQAGKETGIDATDVENLAIENLVLVGDGPSVNLGFGVHVSNTSTNRMLIGFAMDGVEIRGFGNHGAMVTGASLGYENVSIRRCSFSQNKRGGLEVAGKLPWDAKYYAHKSVVVSECVAFDNPGDPAYSKNHSGSGLVVYQVDGGRIEKCAAWNNGENCPAAGGGPVGIWTCASRNVTIEFCESFGNRTRGLDGGGFDIDGGSEQCVLQYNYSHDNMGPGLMVYTYPYASHSDRGNVVRFNISVNDAVGRERYAGLWIRADGARMTGLEVYNNTVVSTGPHAAFVQTEGVEAALRNNIFLSGREGLPLRVEGATNLAGVRLEHNLYWRGGAPFLVRWGGQALGSLNELRAIARQEVAGEETLGVFLDPQIEVVSRGAGRPLENLRMLAQFKPGREAARLNGRRTGAQIDWPFRDFLGKEFKPSDAVPIGAIGGI